MEKLLRIAEGDPAVKYQLIASAMSVDPKATPPQALARIVRVLGAAYELFGDRELLPVLDGFAQNELVADTVEFERALIRIDMGLEAGRPTSSDDWRYVVVAVVPGNRRRPSDTITGEAEPA